MTARLPVHDHHSGLHVSWLPRTSLGWWGFGLTLLAAVAGPGWWVIFQPSSPVADFIDDPDARVRMLLTVAVAVPAVIVGVAALMRRDSRSLGLIMTLAVLFVEVAFAVFWLVAFGSGVAGLCVALGAAAAALVGALAARTRSATGSSRRTSL